MSCVAWLGECGSDGAERDVTDYQRRGAGVGIDEAGAGHLEFAGPASGGGGGERGWVVRDVSGEGAGGDDVGGDAGAGDVQPLHQRGGGETGGDYVDGGGAGLANVGEVAGNGE